MDKSRVIMSLITGVLIGGVFSFALSIFNIDLGTWLGLLLFAASMVAGWFLYPKIRKLWE